MSRLILIDPSLVSTVGHHHEFAHNVLSAATTWEMSGVLAGNRRCMVAECGGWPVRPIYRDGMWTHQSGSFGLKLLSYAVSATRRGGGGAEPLSALLQRARDQWRSRRFADDTERFLREIHVGAQDLIFLPNATSTEVEGVRRLLSRSPEARQASWHLEFHFNVFPRATPHVPEHWRSTRELQAGLRRLRQAARETRLFLYTDTDELTEQYEALQAGPFHTLPIPVDPVYRLDDSRAEEQETRPIRIAYVGDARGEKGYPQLPEMIGAIWKELVEPGKVQFSIQSNCRAARSERPALEARDKLAALDGQHIELLHEPLSTDAYRSLVLGADLLLLPYDPDAYEARSSGILSEALTAGIPVVVPEGTWMAAQLAEPIRRYRSELQSLGVRPEGGRARGAEGISISSGHSVGDIPQSTVGVVYPPGPVGMAQGVREIAAHRAHYRATARVWSAVWAKRHNPQVLVSILREQAQGRSSQVVLRSRSGSGT